MPKKPLTLQQAADKLQVHYMTVYRYVRTGKLPATRVGSVWQVDPDDLAQLKPAVLRSARELRRPRRRDQGPARSPISRRR